MSMKFDAFDEAQIARLCETFVPALPDLAEEAPRTHAFSGRDVRLDRELLEALDRAASPMAVRRLKRFFRGIEQPWVSRAMGGSWKAFSAMTQEEREKLLVAFSHSRLPVARRLFQGLKRLSLFLAYGLPEEGAPHPLWPAFDYPGPRLPQKDAWGVVEPSDGHSREQANPTPVWTPEERGEITADVVIVGSGAGGGVVAAQLAQAGLDVLVIEKGEAATAETFRVRELAGMRRFFEKQGSLTTSDLGLIVLAGSVLGGGTTVNWQTCLAPPDAVRRQWANEFGFDEAIDGRLDAAIAVVRERMNIQTDESPANRQNALLEAGCQALGYRCETIPRNALGCIGTNGDTQAKCDFCGFGCPHAAKQDTRVTYLADAVAAGARILCRTEAERLRFEGKRATGLDVVMHDASGRHVRRTIRAKAFVLSAGSLHTPTILMRSGYAHPHLGTLYLHPTTAVFGRYAEPVKAWEGVPQSRVCNEFDDLDGGGYGARIECAPAHPGLWGMNLPWESAADHRRLMEQLPYLGNLIVLGRDKRPGRVTLGEDGQPLIEYRLHRDDEKTLMAGVAGALKIERAAGAVEVFGPQVNCGSYHPSSSTGEEAGFERYLDRVRTIGLPLNACGLYSAHQMGTCRLAASRSDGPVRLDGRMHDLADVFVADGSLLPTPPGVNPMLSILGVSQLLAERIAEKLLARQPAAR